jgi:hypothetical protein
VTLCRLITAAAPPTRPAPNRSGGPRAALMPGSAFPAVSYERGPPTQIGPLQAMKLSFPRDCGGLTFAAGLDRSGSTNPQRGADAVQIKLAGRPISVSSNAPAWTTMRSGWLSASLNSGVPHLGQKRRRIALPLSAVLTYSLTSPVILKLSVLKITLIDALPDERYWQSLRQQARVAIGSWSKWSKLCGHGLIR